MISSKNPYPTKVRRLQQLEDAGLNVAPFVCFPPGELKISDLKRFFERYGPVSCRTFAADEDRDFKTPVIYEVDKFDVLGKFARLQNKKYFLLVNQALPLADSRVAGNLLFRSENDFLCEYFRGPGTPRDMESRDVMRFTASNFGREAWIMKLVTLVSRFRQRPAIFEFSLYPYPVGQRKENLVFWEWRKA
jgi:hypothetical protein